MRLDIDSFRSAVKRVLPALGTNRAIHQGVRVWIKELVGHVEAHDGDTHFGASFTAKDTDSKSINLVVPARSLSRFLEKLEGDHIELTLDGSYGVSFRSDEAELFLHQFKVDDWQAETPPEAPDHSVSPELVRRIARVLFAASTDKDRGILTGVLLDGTTATATDSKRLARIELSENVPTCIVPADFLRHPLSHGTESMTIHLYGGRVVLRNSSGFWSTSLLQGEYPDATRLISQAIEGTLRLQRPELLAALDKLLVLDDLRCIHLTVETNTTALLHGEVKDLGRVEDRVACVSNWSGQLCFPIRDLLDAVKAGEGDELPVGVTESLGPAVIVTGRLAQAVMPRRCRDC